MPKFAFRLEAVLKQRRWEEQQRQRDFAVRQAQFAELQSRLQQNASQLQAANQDLRDKRLTGPLDLSFLAAHRRFVSAMQRSAIAIMQRMTIVNRHLEEARTALTEAGKRRKVIEKLREKHEMSFREEQSRREVRELDDIAQKMAHVEVF